MSLFLRMSTKQPFRQTLWGNRNMPPGGETQQQCCTVPGDVSACCATEVKRDLYFQTSHLFKRKVR